MFEKNIVTTGKPLTPESKVLIMVHGRGANAEDILSLSASLHVDEFSLVAPQATNNTWYPYTFLAPPAANEPHLTESLNILGRITEELYRRGVPAKQIYFAGFSQGACLMLEFTARNAARYGGVAAFTGGLIGDKINNAQYKGNFENTPVFIGSADPDMHVPVERVYATTNILRNMGASVTEKIYPGMGHTINFDEIAEANRLIFAGSNDQ